MATNKQLLEGFKSQFNTGRLFTESQALILMGYARGDTRKMIKDLLPAENDIERELIDSNGSSNSDPAVSYRVGYRKGSKMILDLVKKLL
jgi:hypothetical protein